MSILHINCNYTGTALHQNMVEKLNELGVKNSVFVPVHMKHVSAVNPAKYVTVAACFHKWERLFFKHKQHKIYASLLNSYNPTDFDIIHAYTLFTDGNCAYEISKKYHLPYIVTIRNTDLNGFFKLRPDLRNRGIEIMQEAAAICFLSPAYKKQLFLKYIPRMLWKKLLKKVYVVPNGIDDFWHRNIYDNRDYKKILTRFQRKELFVVYVGQINKNKNLLTTCKALDDLVEAGWKIHYTAVGKVIDCNVAKLIEKRPYAKILSSLPKEKLINVYRENDIFVMPSFKETFGLVYAEAMSQGLPVIYSQGQGFDRQFREGDVGFHVRANNYKDIERYILRCIKRYEYMSRTALQGISKFQWKKIGKRYFQIYENALNN